MMDDLSTLFFINNICCSTRTLVALPPRFFPFSFATTTTSTTTAGAGSGCGAGAGSGGGAGVTANLFPPENLFPGTNSLAGMFLG